MKKKANEGNNYTKKSCTLSKRFLMKTHKTSFMSVLPIALLLGGVPRRIFILLHVDTEREKFPLDFLAIAV
jgi:hypothetical protein